MKIALRTALLLLLASSIFPAASHGQKGDLPIDPDSIYHVLAGTSEQMLGDQEVPEQLSVAEWRADLDTLAAAMQRRMPYANAALGPRFASRLDSLKQAVPGQSRDQRILSLMHLLNAPAAGTGHNRIRTIQRALGWRALPVWLWRFDDGVYVMAAANEALIGREVLSIDGVPIDDVYARLAPYTSADNRWHRTRRIEEQFLRWINPLHAVGVAQDTSGVTLRTRPADGPTQSVTVSSMQPMDPDWVRFRVSLPEVPPDLQWSAAAEYQDNSEPFYRVSYRDSTDLLYVQFNTVLNESDFDAFSDQSVADLADSLRTIVDARSLDKFVLDLRTNTGGNFQLVEPLVDLLSTHPKIDRPGTLYTLISSVTFSAAGVFAMKLERRTKTTFAGEPGGFAPNIWGAVTPVVLPNSKVTAHLSYDYNQKGMPESGRTHLRPDLHVPLTSDQHFQNVDSTMMAVRRHEPVPRKTVSLTAAERKLFTGTYRMSSMHRAEITTEENGLHLRVDQGQPFPFIDTDLHPLSSRQRATDITNVHVERRPDKAGLTLDWKDTTYALEPVDSGFTLPLEHIRAGRFDEGAAGFRSAEAAGLKLDTGLIMTSLTDLIDEHPLPAWPDSLSETERARRALPYTQLATELAPTSYLAFFELAYIYKLLGQDDKMRATAQKAVRMGPIRARQYVREYLDLTVTPGGQVE